MAERCVATTQGGERCGAKPLAGQTRCPWHTDDPVWVERRREWSVKGGRGKSNASRAKRHLPAGLLTVDELRGTLGLTIKRVIDGELEPSIGNSVAALARAYLAATEAGAVEDLQRRLDELERLAVGRSA